jgi:hypothetical protein
LESTVAETMRSIEPGTSAVRSPAAPIRPTIHGSNCCRETRKSARSASDPSRAGTLSIAAKPTKKAKSIISW